MANTINESLKIVLSLSIPPSEYTVRMIWKCIFSLQVVSCLRPLQPRLYSISSSSLEDSTKVGITVAEVTYSSLGSLRKGVASTFLTQRSKVWLLPSTRHILQLK